MKNYPVILQVINFPYLTIPRSPVQAAYPAGDVHTPVVIVIDRFSKKVFDIIPPNIYTTI